MYVMTFTPIQKISVPLIYTQFFTALFFIARIFTLLFFTALFFTASSLSALATPSHTAQDNSQPLQIVTQPLEVTAQAHEVYFYRLLELALQKTSANYGPYELRQITKHLSHKRYLAEVTRDHGIIDLTWTMTSAERETDMLPIKISLLRGMNSYRVFLVRKEDLPKFAQITTLEQLKAYSAGSGSDWPDTPILKSNGLPVVTSAHYELLFTMLARKRFDYFPRGVYEVWNEQEAHASKGFVIEPNLMFHYPAPIYFFVNKNKPELAQRIKEGLEIAIADGSFEQLFFSIPGFKRGYQEMTSKRRRIIRLDVLHNAED